MASGPRSALAPAVATVRAALLVVPFALLVVLLALLMTASAGAEPGFEYEEARRFGGFDSSAYNTGQFGGPLTPGRFVDPTGFAVDPIDNTVYVVDRTSSALAKPTDWRIQQFSPGGALLGTTMFTLPDEPAGKFGKAANASAIEGLAVDHKARRLYALVVGSAPSHSPYPSFTAAQELLAWSTTPKAGGLVAATAGGGGQLPPDPLASEILGSPGTVGGVVSSEKQLLSGETPLYGPQGIAVDPLEGSVDNPVAIEASNLDGLGVGTPIPGDTIVQQVATQPQGASATGDLLGRWSSSSVAGALGQHEGPHGISTDPDGTLIVLLDAAAISPATEAYVVKLKADLGEATVLNNPADVPPLGDADQAPIYGNESPFLTTAGAGVSDLKGVGSQVVQLSGATPGSHAGPYAGVFFSHEQEDFQVSPTGPPGSEYWTSGESSSEEFEANIGVRLLAPEADGSISNLQGRTIVNTLGNSERGGHCNIGASEAGLAAGADGSLWVLDRGPRTDQPEARGQGREVIELVPGSPGSGQVCPKPFGTFTMAVAGGQPTAGEEPKLTVPAGTQVTFNAALVKHMGTIVGGVNRLGGKPFAYEWDLDGDPTDGAAGDGFEKIYEMEPIHYYYPPSSVNYAFTRTGEYRVRLRVRTDYGVYEPPHPGIVTVTKAPFHPEPRFTVSTSGGQQVTVNASGSTPGVGKIVNYHWNWGDGGEEDEEPQTPIVAHIYAHSGAYQVTLTVTNSAYQSVTSAPQTVTVVVPQSPKVAVSLTAPLYDIPAPFALYPIPATHEDRTPTRLSPRARFAGGALSVTLACPATKQLCAGTVSVETAAALATAAKTGRRAHRTRRRLLLGHASFTIPGGHSATVKVRLSARGKALLQSSKRLKVLVVVAAHDSLGDPGTRTLGLTLSAPAAHRRRPSASKKHRGR
jgi:PKD repeat protein